MNSKVISILNQKGGVGKTTTAVNLATGFSVVDKKTLLIDSLENVVADRNPHISTSVDMISIEKAQNLMDILNQEVR